MSFSISVRSSKSFLAKKKPVASSCLQFLCSRKFSTTSPCSEARNPALVSAKPSSPAPEVPNELLRIIHTQIKTNGPMPLPRYIQLCLSHPTLGYYTRAQRNNAESDAVIGKRGDFITSPEISQVFGELLAIWYISQWQAQGMPAKCRIIELGPGRGTLMDDMLRTFASIKTLGQTLEDVHLVDTSEYMRNLQKEKLANHSGKYNLHWHDRIQEVPQLEDDKDVFTMVIAHEFFDALPIHLFEKRAPNQGFREVFVDVDTSITTNIEDKDKPRLRYVVSPSATLASRLLLPEEDKQLKELSEGARVEICPEAYEIAANAAKLVSGKGAGLIIDYGGEQIFGNSFRGFKAHKIVDPLAEPGSADLTSNVNFTFIREALTNPRLSKNVDSPPPDSLSNSSESTSVYVPAVQSQRSFLLSLGLQLRVQKLIDQSKDIKRREEIIKSAERLVDKNEKIHGMGKVFKVLGFVPKTGDGGQQDVFPFGLELD